jgi:hypothetical protein
MKLFDQYEKMLPKDMKKKQKREGKTHRKRQKKMLKKLAKYEKQQKKLKEFDKKLVSTEPSLPSLSPHKHVAEIRGILIYGLTALSYFPFIVTEALRRQKYSISRYAPCLTFLPDDDTDEQPQDMCIVLKRASHATLEAEKCWVNFVDAMAHCTAQTKSTEFCAAQLSQLHNQCVGV